MFLKKTGFETKITRKKRMLATFKGKCTTFLKCSLVISLEGNLQMPKKAKNLMLANNYQENIHNKNFRDSSRTPSGCFIMAISQKKQT